MRYLYCAHYTTSVLLNPNLTLLLALTTARSSDLHSQPTAKIVICTVSQLHRSLDHAKQLYT